MGFFLGVVVVLAIVASFALTQIWARQQLDLELSCSVAEATASVESFFGPTWTAVHGEGTLNYRPKLRMNAPTISIQIRGSGLAGSHVSVWTSRYKTVYGGMYHAGLMARKKRGLARALSVAIVEPAIS